MNGVQLAAARKAAKVSRYELGAEMGVPYSRVQRVEEGHVEASEEFVRQFCAAVALIAERRAKRAAKTLAGVAA